MRCKINKMGGNAIYLGDVFQPKMFLYISVYASPHSAVMQCVYAIHHKVFYMH